MGTQACAASGAHIDELSTSVKMLEKPAPAVPTPAVPVKTCTALPVEKLPKDILATPDILEGPLLQSGLSGKRSAEMWAFQAAEVAPERDSVNKSDLVARKLESV